MTLLTVNEQYLVKVLGDFFVVVLKPTSVSYRNKTMKCNTKENKCTGLW